MLITDASSGYQNLKLNKKSLYIRTFACQFGRYRFTRLRFEVAPSGDMFQQMVDKIFKDLSSVLSIADDVGHDTSERDHIKTLKEVMKICW